MTTTRSRPTHVGIPISKAAPAAFDGVRRGSICPKLPKMEQKERNFAFFCKNIWIVTKKIVTFAASIRRIAIKRLYKIGGNYEYN